MELNYRVIPNYPKDGVNFIDMDSVYRNQLTDIIRDIRIHSSLETVSSDAIVAVGSRGWIVGSILAYWYEIPLILARDESKALKDWVFTEPFQNEYDSRRFGLSPDITKYNSVVIVDDLIATGNTIKALEDLILSFGVKVDEIIATVRLKEFNPEFKSPIYVCKEISCEDLLS